MRHQNKFAVRQQANGPEHECTPATGGQLLSLKSFGRNTKRLAVLSVSLAVLGFSGCGDSNSGGSSSAPPPPPPPPAATASNGAANPAAAAGDTQVAMLQPPAGIAAAAPSASGAATSRSGGSPMDVNFALDYIPESAQFAAGANITKLQDQSNVLGVSLMRELDPIMTVAASAGLKPEELTSCWAASSRSKNLMLVMLRTRDRMNESSIIKALGGPGTSEKAGRATVFDLANHPSGKNAAAFADGNTLLVGRKEVVIDAFNQKPGSPVRIGLNGLAQPGVHFWVAGVDPQLPQRLDALVGATVDVSILVSQSPLKKARIKAMAAGIGGIDPNAIAAAPAADAPAGLPPAPSRRPGSSGTGAGGPPGGPPAGLAGYGPPPGINAATNYGPPGSNSGTAAGRNTVVELAMVMDNEGQVNTLNGKINDFIKEIDAAVAASGQSSSSAGGTAPGGGQSSGGGSAGAGTSSGVDAEDFVGGDANKVQPGELQPMHFIDGKLLRGIGRSSVLPQAGGRRRGPSAGGSGAAPAGPPPIGPGATGPGPGYPGATPGLGGPNANSPKVANSLQIKRDGTVLRLFFTLDHGAALGAGPSVTDVLNGMAASVVSDGVFEGTGIKLTSSFAKLLAEKPDMLGGKEVDGLPLEYGYSWMTGLLPYIGHEYVHDKFDFDKPWIEDDNLRAARAVVPAFLNPADPRSRWSGRPYQFTGLTHFAGMSGIESGRNEVAAQLPRSDARAGIFGYDSIAKPADITDGTANTIALIGTGNIAGPWVAAGGSTIRGARKPYFSESTGFGSIGLPRPGTYVLMADGSARIITADIDPEVFASMCTIHGAEKIDMSKVSAFTVSVSAEAPAAASTTAPNATGAAGTDGKTADANKAAPADAKSGK